MKAKKREKKSFMFFAYGGGHCLRGSVEAFSHDAAVKRARRFLKELPRMLDEVIEAKEMGDCTLYLWWVKSRDVVLVVDKKGI